MPTIIQMSIVAYNDDRFEIIIKDEDTFEELSFTGQKKMNEKMLEFSERIAPACVWTTYRKEE